MISRLRLSFVVSIMALLAVAVPPATAAPTGDGTGSLYLVQAGGGTLSGSKLVLRNVDPTVASFTDRPQRSSESLPATEFANRWSALFGDDPPNAALEVDGAPATRDVALVELRDPRYDAARRTLTYSVKRLRSVGDPALHSFDLRADGYAVKRFAHSTLFIDESGSPSIPVTASFVMPIPATAKVTFTDSQVEPGQGVEVVGFMPQGTAFPEFGPFVIGGSEVECSSNGSPIENATVNFSIRGPASGTPVTGFASVPPGINVQLTVGGVRQTLTNGPFRISPPGAVAP